MKNYVKVAHSSLLGLFLAVWLIVTHAEENPYAENYTAQQSKPLKSMLANPEPQLEVKNQKIKDNSIDSDNFLMLEDGYDMLGWSGFSANSAPQELAVAHGRSIKADKVVLYVHQGNEQPEASTDAGDEPKLHYYYASYWVTIPKPTLGVHVVKLKKLPTKKEVEQGGSAESKEETGLKIIAVVKDTAAAKAGIVRGDMILKLGDATTDSQEALIAAVQRYKGQTVPAGIVRNGKQKEIQVVLKPNS